MKTATNQLDMFGEEIDRKPKPKPAQRRPAYDPVDFGKYKYSDLFGFGRYREHLQRTLRRATDYPDAAGWYLAYNWNTLRLFYSWFDGSEWADALTHWMLIPDCSPAEYQRRIVDGK